MRQHFYNVYAYCRWADDLADETGDAAASLDLLRWWQEELDRCYAGEATHPVFIALRETIDRFRLPKQPFADLLVAFRQDQHVTRYETVDDLLGYCRNSANPVGRIVLYLAESYNDENAALSDFVCSGLQWANFCQDVANDCDRGRIYLPQESCRRFGFVETDFARREATPAFRELLACEVNRAESWLRAGLPLANRMPGRLSVDIRLFALGGLAILDRIRKLQYDVWQQRPKVSKLSQLGLLLRALLRR